MSGENRWDDDRPGMMRVHIAQQRADALERYYTRNGLRGLAKSYRIPSGYPTKRELATALAFVGAVPPGYDKGAER